MAQPDDIPERWRTVAREATRQRMERHEHLDAVAQALREVPGSVAWKGLEPLSELEVPVLIVGSQDDSDTLHPLGVAEEYCRKLPNAELVVEDKGGSPLAWQGARLSNVIARLLRARGLYPGKAALKVSESRVWRFPLRNGNKKRQTRARRADPALPQCSS